MSAQDERTKLVVVYRALQESVEPVLEVLRKEGFNPVALENPDSDALFVPNNPRYLRAVRHVAHIAVPSDEARGAALVLRKWDKAREAEVHKIAKGLWGRVLLSFLLALPITGGLSLLGIGSDDAIVLLLGVWFGIVLLVSHIGRGLG